MDFTKGADSSRKRKNPTHIKNIITRFMKETATSQHKKTVNTLGRMKVEIGIQDLKPKKVKPSRYPNYMKESQIKLKKLEESGDYIREM